MTFRREAYLQKIVSREASLVKRRWRTTKYKISFDKLTALSEVEGRATASLQPVPPHEPFG
jgi:hypothetical protein